MEVWVDEKEKKLCWEAEERGQLKNLEEKMRRLQKHQAFEAELTANEPKFKQIKLQVGITFGADTRPIINNTSRYSFCLTLKR